jgi:RNA polymerase sigma factor (sigma-70 family)
MSPLALSLKFLQAQPDSRLLALAREGHEPAFEALVRRYRKELLSYCRRLQPRSGSAEDALQQTLLQAWRALAAGADVRDVRPWLYRIAHNVTLNNLRVAVAVPHEIQETAGGAEVDQLVEQRLRARAALAGMASLPALQRQVLVRTTLDGASHEEVASALGLTSGAVRGLIYRARATLRSAAAALTPSPALHWAVRRAETRAGGSPTIIEAIAGGGSAGVAGLVMKGSAVLTVAGAVAGGGVILSHTQSHPRRTPAPLLRRSDSRRAGQRSAAFLTSDRALSELRAAAATASGNRNALSARSGSAELRGRDGGSSTGDRQGSSGGTSGGSRGGSDGGSTIGSSSGSSTGSGSGSDGGSGSGATIASSTTGTTTSGSSDGGIGSPGTSGSGDGTSGGSGSTSGALATTTDGGVVSSGSNGGSSSGSDGSGSGETTTTTTTVPH